ncbi:MAG: hypothetical protein WDN01_20205 [Rhizomicrobium sp.]
MLLVALLAVAALDNAVCYAEDIQASAVTGVADKGTPAQSPDADHVCQHGHHHQTSIPVLGEKGLTLAVCLSDAFFPSERAHASLVSASLERPPRI